MIGNIKGETFVIIAFMTLTTSYSSYPLFAHFPPPIKDRQLSHDIWVRVLCKKPQALIILKQMARTNLMRNYCVSMHFAVNVEAEQLRK